MISPSQSEPGETAPPPGAEFVECPRCGSPAPAENLNCIYCGERLPLPVGLLSSLSGGWKGRAGIILAVLSLISFLFWIL